MSPPGTPVLGNGTLTLPLNPNRFPKSHPPAAIVASELASQLIVNRASVRSIQAPDPHMLDEPPLS